MRCVGLTAIRFNATDTGLDLFIGSWITAHLVCNGWWSTAVLTGISYNQVSSTKWEHGGVQIQRRSMRIEHAW